MKGLHKIWKFENFHFKIAETIQNPIRKAAAAQHFFALVLLRHINFLKCVHSYKHDVRIY